MNYIWLIPIAFSVHELEEWNILKWYRKYFSNLPDSSNTSIRIHIVTLSLVAFLLTYLARILSGTFAFSLIIAFLSAFILLNFIQHIIWTAQLRAYSPGLLTSCLSVMVVTLVHIELIQSALFSLPFYALVVFTIMPIRETLKVKGEMTPEIRKVHEFFIKIEKMLRRGK